MPVERRWLRFDKKVNPTVAALSGRADVILAGTKETDPIILESALLSDRISPFKSLNNLVTYLSRRSISIYVRSLQAFSSALDAYELMSGARITTSVLTKPLADALWIPEKVQLSMIFISLATALMYSLSASSISHLLKDYRADEINGDLDGEGLEDSLQVNSILHLPGNFMGPRLVYHESPQDAASNSDQWKLER